MEHVQCTFGVTVTPAVSQVIHAEGRAFLERQRPYFRTSLLHIYLRHGPEGVICTGNLFTDAGRFHTIVERGTSVLAVKAALAHLTEKIDTHVESCLNGELF